MKTPSSFKGSRRPRALLGSPAALIAAALIFIALVLFLLRAFAPGALDTIARPFWSAGTGLSAAVSGGTSGLRNNATLLAERDALAAENAALRSQNVALTAKAQDLEATLGARTAPAPQIVAGVLARPPVAAYDVLIVDQGSSAGITEGAPAFGAGGTPLGRVQSVSANTARIVLYSSAGSRTEGWLGVNRVPVTLAGMGSGAFEATLPRDAGVLVGDGAFVPGPGALPIGSVVRVDTDPSSPSVVIHIRPYINPFSVTWVSVGSI